MLIIICDNCYKANTSLIEVLCGYLNGIPLALNLTGKKYWMLFLIMQIWAEKVTVTSWEISPSVIFSSFDIKAPSVTIQLLFRVNMLENLLFLCLPSTSSPLKRKRSSLLSQSRNHSMWFPFSYAQCWRKNNKYLKLIIHKHWLKMH